VVLCLAPRDGPSTREVIYALRRIIISPKRPIGLLRSVSVAKHTLECENMAHYSYYSYFHLVSIGFR